MCLLNGANPQAVITDHVAKALAVSTLPQTKLSCMTSIYTSLAVIDINRVQRVLTEGLSGLSLADPQAMTGIRIVIIGPIHDLI